MNPEDLMRMHKPGIVPLRPITLGEIFDGSLQTMRRNPEATIGLALLVLAIFLLPSIGLSLAADRLPISTFDAQVAGIGVTFIASALSSLALSGLIMYVVSEAVLGDRAGIGQTWRAVRGRIPALIGVSLLTFVIYFVALLALVLVMMLLALVAAQGIGALGFLMILLMIPAALWLYARLALAAAAVVLERTGPINALRRSWSLTQGRQAWRVVGITLVAAIVAMLFSLVISIPLELISSIFVTGVSGLEAGPTDLAPFLISSFISLIVDSVVTPFTAGVTALLYLDLRMRREGLDVALVQAAQVRAAERRS